MKNLIYLSKSVDYLHKLLKSYYLKKLIYFFGKRTNISQEEIFNKIKKHTNPTDYINNLSTIIPIKNNRAKYTYLFL